MLVVSSIVLDMVTRYMVFSVAATESPANPPSSTRPLKTIPSDSITWYDQRRQNNLYADKTVYLERLLENEGSGIFFYITRPRRFGKSSFLQMAQYFFMGNGTLFEGLKIYDRGNTDFFRNRCDIPEELNREKWIRCPVIYLDFSAFENFHNESRFMGLYFQSLRFIAKSYGLDHDVPDISIVYLITELQLKFKLKVVVLIDEYDSPYHTAIKRKDRALAQDIRYFLDEMLLAIKSQNEILRLVLVVGVSRLGLSSLQSCANNYEDLTYNENFASAFGLTSDEMKDFYPEIKDRFNLTNEEQVNEFLDRLRQEYDGYNFTFQYTDGKKKNVMNPVSTMKCLKNKKIECYWSETSKMNEVIRRLYFSKEPLEVYTHKKLLKKNVTKRRNPALEAIPLEILMLLYGYLTIESYDEENETVVINFPNNEVRKALQGNIDDYEAQVDDFLSEEHGWLFELRWHMETGRLGGTMNTLTNMFGTSFSKTLQQGLNEFSNTARLVEKMRMAGIPCRESIKFQKENSAVESGGDVDVQTVRLKKNFIMSIKHDYSATTAMNQLIKYLKEQRTTFLEAIGEPDEAWFVGINFDSRTGGILNEWIGMPFKNGNLCFDQCEASLPRLCQNFDRV